MRILRPILVLTAAIVCKSNAAPNATPALYGKWELVAVDCADHKLGVIGEMGRKALTSKAMNELLEVTRDFTESTAMERLPPIVPDKYCETVLRSKWSVKGDLINVSGDSLKSRQGRGGYKCKGDLDDKAISKKSYQLKFKVIGDTLEIINHDITIVGADRKTVHLCQAGANYIRSYRRVKK
jgi:hypothetical protein